MGKGNRGAKTKSGVPPQGNNSGSGADTRPKSQPEQAAKYSNTK